MQMKVIKQRICFLLSVVIVVSGLLTACQNTTNMQADSETNSVSESVSEEMEVTEDIVAVKEYERAVAYGLVPEGWEDDLQKSVSYKEFCELISSLIQITKPEKIDGWNKLAAEAMLSDNAKHGVHIQLSISNAFNGSGSFDISDNEWELFRAYWEAIAVRYAGIPTCYLTFDLANEIQPSPENVASAVNHLQDVVNSVRNADSNRVLLLSFNANPWKEWVEGVADLGLSLAYHPYRPEYIMEGGQYYYAPADTPWPYPYFPKRLQSTDTLTVSGDIGGKALRLDFWVYDPFKVTFDNGEMVKVTVEGDYIHEDSCGLCFYEPYTIEIPEGVSSLVLQPLQNEVTFDEIGIVSDTESRWLIPHEDVYGSSSLIYKEDKGWSSEENYTAEMLYSNNIEPIQKVAREHNVGFMINEIGSFAAGIGWDVSVKLQYDSELIEILEAKDISWCMCEMDYMSEPYWEVFDEWENTTVENYIHTSEDGHRHIIQYSVELLEMYRQFITK